MRSDTVFFCCVAVFWLNSMIGLKRAVSKRDAFLLRLAMTATLAADFCMLMLHDDAEGLKFFLLAQFFHNLRYDGKKMAVWQVKLCGLAWVITGLWGLDPLTRLAACYLTAFLVSLRSVYGLTKPWKRGRYPDVNRLMIVLGMGLFFLCDINVGLYNLTGGTAANGVFRALMWVFYLPGQLLLSSSGRRYGTRGESVKRGKGEAA